MSNPTPPPPPPSAPTPPPGAPPPAAPMSAREAKAEARAARARAKALRPWYRKKRWWLLGVVVVIVAASIAASGGDDDDAPATRESGGVEADVPGGGRSAGGQDVYAIGQTARTGDFDVTLHTVEDPYVPSNPFDRPGDGNRFVAVELTATNTSDVQKPLSTMLGAEVTDSLSRPWDVAFAGFDLPQLDGMVPAGESRRGWIVFEVPNDATGLRLRIKGNLTATGSLFALS